MDPGLNQLLKWSIENADVSSDDPTASGDPKAARPSGQPLDAEALKILMGGPSDADLMRESIAAVQSPDISLEDKLVAFDNLEQLIENIDNANNMQTLGLWTPLVGLLRSEEGELRRMAAWCMGTAVQNNVQAQERVSSVSTILSRCIEFSPCSLILTYLVLVFSSSSSAPSPPSLPSPCTIPASLCGGRRFTPSRARSATISPRSTSLSKLSGLKDGV